MQMIPMFESIVIMPWYRGKERQYQGLIRAAQLKATTCSIENGVATLGSYSNGLMKVAIDVIYLAKGGLVIDIVIDVNKIFHLIDRFSLRTNKPSHKIKINTATRVFVYNFLQ